MIFRKVLSILFLSMASMMAMAQTSKTYYVKANGDANADGQSWTNATTLSAALDKAVAGDQIFVMGYETLSDNTIYIAPTNGFKLKSGVRLYGGFSGKETNPIGGQIESKNTKYTAVYQSVLSGDINNNDQVSANLLLFPENSSRTDNAVHVLTMDLSATSDNPNSNNTTTVVNGFVIAGGQANEKGNNKDTGHGGGILVINSSDQNTNNRAYEISQCFFVNNYGNQGGALYVDESVTSDKSVVKYCGFYNNLSGNRGSNANTGGGLWIGGSGTIHNSVIFNNVNGGLRISPNTKVVNCTVVHNTSSAADLTKTGSVSGGGTLYNTLLWGSTTLCKSETRPQFASCAFPEVEATQDGKDNNNNLKISTLNQDTNQPAAWLTTPTSVVGFDHSFDFKANTIPPYSVVPEERSALLNAGNMDYYTQIVGENDNVDLSGNIRYKNNLIDIGCYESEQVAAGRRLYVTEKGGSEGKDGSDWAHAMTDVQNAINTLAENHPGERGEVWVAKGAYTPTRIGNSSSLTEPYTFVMKDGISVYGGFEGNETSLEERDQKRGNHPWEYNNQTIFRGKDYQENDAQWNASSEMWTVSSGSCHVVWFAPLPGEANFSLSTYLDGVTIEGGSSNGQNGIDSKYNPFYGAGIYLEGSTNVVRNCIVRNNSAGMSNTTNTAATTRGGAIYNKSAQVRSSLIYNNSADEGGAIYVDGVGFVNTSMISNNSAVNGSGVYLKLTNEAQTNYQILATSIVTNNTSRRNAAVYVDGAGLVEQNTIANNYASNVRDAGAYTSGIYVKNAGTVANNIIWNNTLQQVSNGRNASILAQIYTEGSSRNTALFYNNAISDVNASNWNDAYQSGTFELTSNIIENVFELGKGDQYNSLANFTDTKGVQGNWKDIDYFWKTPNGSVLRNKGLNYAELPGLVLYKPTTSFDDQTFSSRPPIGAYMSNSVPFVFEKDNTVLRLYFDHSNSSADGNGSSWNQSASSLNEILSYLGTLDQDSQVSYLSATGTASATLNRLRATGFEIWSREGVITPVVPYTFQENEPLARTFTIPATNYPILIKGGYPATGNPTDSDRNIEKYRTEINGNASGSQLSDGLYHLFRIEEGANVTLDGIAITHGYAAGTAYIPYGGAILIGSVQSTGKTTQVTVRNAILEDNTALDGAAIATLPEVTNVKLTLENTVVNNNTCALDYTNNDATTKDKNLIELNNGAGNTLTLHHVSFINNYGAAPAAGMTTSLAVGNQIYDEDGYTTTGAHNTHTLATVGKEGAQNFANPTNKIGATMNGNVYYGGYAKFRPLTSSNATANIINQVKGNETLAQDITGEERNLGGAPDLGAYEAILPKAGKIIYVRSYNTDWKQGDCKSGMPDFHLLAENPGAEYDGTTWSRAIMGNAICNNNIARNGNDFYVLQGDSLLAATLDNPLYGNDYNASSAPYGQTSNAFSSFFPTGTTGASNGNRKNVWINGANYNIIENKREEQYVSGLQYAVEQAAQYNKNHPNEEPMAVWVGAGVYTDYKGFVIRDGVKVYGGFSKDGNPGEDDRRPLLSQYVPARKEYESLQKADYETILQVRWESPVYMTTSSKEMWWSEGKPQDGSDFDFIDKAIRNRICQRHYVLYQPDECITTWNIESNTGEGRNNYVSADQYRYPGSGMGYDDTQYYREYKNVTWDGFSIRHGYLTNYKANRDGGAGVRVFRGINLENLIIVHNFAHGIRSRGGGLYMDGSNSTIKNSYLLENMTGASAPGTPYSGGTDSYGGGAYMLTGTGYNMVVASNRSTGGTCRGGGIFIENAKFYNNTVAYNHAPEGAGIEHWQGEATGITSALTLYNCIVFENFQDTGKNAKQIDTMEPKSFQAKNCFIKGDLPNELIINGNNGNIVVPSDDKTINPFTKEFYTGAGERKFSPVRLANDYHLNEADGLDKNPCLNGGTEEDFDVPITDMDYTNRIKDCAIDIGAYEADNTANIKPETKVNLEGTTEHEGIEDYVYYVTQNGAGNRSGDSPKNAACAEKLQSVLTAAGVLAKTVNKFGQSDVLDNNKKHKVYVKVAGYKPDDDGNRFVYHANTLADPEDPQSYTFLIPDGVWLMGGYYEGGEMDKNGQEIPANWDVEKRDVITDYRTVLSAKTEPKLGSTITQEVNGYHTVTFGKWPTGNEDDYNKTALTYRAVLDGVYLTDGKATDNAGFKGVGGGAVVPEYAHVRNCFAAYNEAIKGGAFFTLPGGMVSGCVIRNNTAQQGGAIYTANAGKSDRNFHSYIVSCTIVDNTAQQGGGIYQELGTIMGGNLVVYGNNADTDKNISGVTNEQYEDDFMRQIETSEAPIKYYPYNDCFIEKYAMSANTHNTSMDDDEETYFMSSGGYYPRPYSPLVENGVLASYYKGWVQIGILPYDILGVTRKTETSDNDQVTRLTAGAYAMSLPSMNTDAVLKRLFVSIDGGTDQVSDEEKQKYLGRSFYTPFNSLDAALAYINEVRKDNKDADNDSEHPFEILMTGGTYKPSVTREDASSSEANDRRRNSFVIPTNVNIYGGFFATDALSSDPENTPESESFTSLKMGNETVTLQPNGDIKDILAARNKNHMTDINKNGLIEPWEFANPTIFSGDLKASATEKKVYHVVYSKIAPSDQSSAERDNDVLLDGITIMDGQTGDDVNCDEPDVDENTFDEMGHGGGIYSCYVSYTLNRCRVLNNIAVHGAGIYVRNASLDIMNSIVAGNWAGLETANSNMTVEGRGGGVMLYLTQETYGNLHALNSIFVNNTASNADRAGGTGGAIYVNMAEKKLADYQALNITNCIIASNEANTDGGVHVEYKPNNAGPLLFNTVLWNNVGTQKTISKIDMWHCASDKLDLDKTRVSADGNVKLDTLNMSATGPRFARPTLGQGSSNNTSNAQWNPASISVLTDAGDGMIPCNTAGEEQQDQEKGKYKEWWQPAHEARLAKYGYRTDYMTLADETDGKYDRYKGPKRADGTQDDKPIDIGLYEFQYSISLSDREALYIGTEDKGKADGSDWDNRSSDLRGAIIAMANPTGNSTTELNTQRRIYVRGGEYYSPSRSSGDAFGLQVSTNDKSKNLITSLEIIGACTNETGTDYTQDFSKPTILVNNPLQSDGEVTNNLLNIKANGKPITISGFTFQNTSTGTNAGVGLYAEVNNTSSDTNGELTLKNCGFRHNANTAMYVNDNAGSVLIYNTLFADGKSDALVTKGKTTIVNATFVNNEGATILGNADVYNTVAWKNNNTSTSLTNDATNKNVVFDDNVANNDVINGPNFTDPENEDYSIRPSSKLLNQGENSFYTTHVGDLSSSSQKDLGNKARLTGENIDIGAYECDSELLPIIYVKAGEGGSGASWDSPTNDLQNAINLAELYANNAQKGSDAYVFVDRNIQAKDIDITLPGVHVYGTMNNQTSSKTATSSSTTEEVKEIVKELLNKRTGILESAVKSTITGISMKPANSDEATKDMNSVVDGFIVNGQANIQGKGYLSTSIINATVTGNEEGTLYNSLALNSVENVKCINVTSTSTLPNTTDSYFNRAGINTNKQNKYVKDDYWCYQINDLTAHQYYQEQKTTRDINTDDEAHKNAEPTKACMDIVEHQVDLAGNKRVRDNVDNGCFETWYIDYDKKITRDDYPHGKSVIYVAEEADKSDGTTKPFHELVLADDLYTEANPFRPGFLLLGHHAGLRGNSHVVSLDNFAVERKLKIGYSDLCVLPFVNTRVEQIKDDGTYLTDQQYSLFYYSGAKRANYDFKYSKDNSEAWVEGTMADQRKSDGMRIDTKQDMTIRFYGNNYSQNATEQSIALTQNNNQQPWSEKGATKFTSKENMGWNLFGSPYICGMNYKDMRYGRVIYAYNSPLNQYTSGINTDGMEEGYIPPFDAVFTQTATLNSYYENISVHHSDQLVGNAYQESNTNAKIALSMVSGEETTRSIASVAHSDALYLNAVSPSEARNDFDMGSDGVKFLSTEAPQLYAIRNGGRYSLLSAVSEAGSVNVGVSLPASGVYRFTVPEDCDASKYEAVTLKDAQTGKAVDLLQGEYDFMATEAGEINNRFTISFNRMEDDLQDQDIKVWIAGSKVLMVSGIQEGDLIHVYTASGQLDATVEAVSSLAKVYLNNGGLMLVEVMRDGKKVAVKKLTVR